MRDPFGLIPPHIKMDHAREDAVDRHLQAAVALATALRRKDRRLELWKASDRLDAPQHGQRPGFWHVVRHNDAPTPDSYLAITTDGLGSMTGNFREPDSGVLHELDQGDMWGRNYRLPTDDYDAVEAATQKERDRITDQRRDQIVEDARAMFRLPGDGGLERKLWGKGGKGIVGR